MSTEVEEAGTNVRSSGRVRKRPETLYDSSAQDVNNKRRHNGSRVSGDSIENEDEDESDESDEAEEGEEDDFRASKSARAKRTSTGRPATKKPKTVATLAIRPAQGKRRAPRSVKTLNGLDAESATGLFAEVFVEGKNPQEIVSEWYDRFKQHEARALAEIVTFVLRATGCASTVTEEEIGDPDAVADRVGDLQEEYQASNPTEYPLMKGRTATTVKQGIYSLMSTLLETMASKGVLYDQVELVENLETWFATMSSAANRPFRHTATIVCLMIMNTFCEIARDLSIDNAKITRQAETEKKKAAKNKARVSDIQKKAKDTQDRQEYVEALLKGWYESVFLHRYKDIDAAIRRECASALGDWIVMLPSVHLDSNHLRYLGFILSDTHVSVRLEAVKQIARFYRVPDLVDGLKLFSEKFRSRLVEMATSDADTAVRTTSVDLLDMMREHGLLEPDDIEAVGRMIFESDDKVRRATSAFLAEGVKELYEVKIDELGGVEAIEEVLPEVGDKDFDSPRLSWLKLKCVVETLQAYHTDEALPKNVERPRAQADLILNATNIDSRFFLAAHDMYSHIEEMSEWRVIAGLLLFDVKAGKSRKRSADSAIVKLRNDCALSDKEEMIMLEMLNVSVKQQILEYTDGLRTTSKKQKADIEDEVETMATDLLSVLPRLLEKYGDSPGTAKLVLHLLQTLDMSLFKDVGRDSTTYNALLEKVKRQFMSHTSDEVLESATKSIMQAASHTDLDEVAGDQLSSLWEEVVLNFVESLQFQDLGKRGNASKDDLTSLHAVLHRIVRLSAVSDPSTMLEDETKSNSVNMDGETKSPIDCVLALMNRAIPQTGKIDEATAQLEDGVATRAAEVMLLYLQWRLASIKQRVEGPNGQDIDYDELAALAGRRDVFSDTISAVLQRRKGKEEISATFAGIWLDLHSATASLENIERNPSVSDDYIVLYIEMQKESQKEILQAFAGAEAVYASLSGKQLDESKQDTSDEVDVDADPISDDEDEPAPAAQTQESQKKSEAKMIATLLAEQRLCQLAGKIVFAVLAGLMDARSTRQRVEKNKAKLGTNFKAVCEYFDMGKSKSKKAVSKPRAEAVNGTKTNHTKSAKSNAIVAESENEDEIEDDENPQSLLRRELIDVDDIREPEDVDAMEE